VADLDELNMDFHKRCEAEHERTVQSTCPSQFQGQFFLIFVGMPAASFGSKIGDHLNTDHMAISSASYGHLFRGLRFSQGRPVTEPIG
jgi:hypothetical protein